MITSSIIPRYPLPSFLSAAEKKAVDPKIKESALKALAELVASLALTVLVTGWLGAGFCKASVVLLGATALSVAIHLVAQVALHLYRGEKSPHHHILEVIHHSLSDSVRSIPQLALVNILNLTGPYFVIHEGGHALAALTLFRQASPEISFTPFRQGVTSFVVSSGLTQLGAHLGRRISLLAVAAAGIVCSTVVALIEFAISHHFQDKFPNLCHWLDLHAKAQILHDLLYCFSAFAASKMDPFHDLMALWQDGGIHPLVPIALMIALPLLQKLWQSFRNDNCNQAKILL